MPFGEKQTEVRPASDPSHKMILGSRLECNMYSLTVSVKATQCKTSRTGSLIILWSDTNNHNSQVMHENSSSSYFFSAFLCSPGRIITKGMPRT